MLVDRASVVIVYYTARWFFCQSATTCNKIICRFFLPLFMHTADTTYHLLSVDILHKTHLVVTWSLLDIYSSVSTLIHTCLWRFSLIHTLHFEFYDNILQTLIDWVSLYRKSFFSSCSCRIKGWFWPKFVCCVVPSGSARLWKSPSQSDFGFIFWGLAASCDRIASTTYLQL